MSRLQCYFRKGDIFNLQGTREEMGDRLRGLTDNKNMKTRRHKHQSLKMHLDGSAVMMMKFCNNETSKF